ncbi:MAG: FtsQ-type POTRA domain-containing protein [Deltaproteobacteria bacterium]|nr:FtsQ-type POTRA domain-containing protein [Deltaproteobacteria bacterium]
MKKGKKSIRAYPARKKNWLSEKSLKVAGLTFAAAILLFVVSLVVYEGLSRSVFFQIEEVVVNGCKRTTPNQILSWSGLDVKTNLWAVRGGRICKKLESQSWIATAAISRNWPNKLTITVSERKPFALVSKKNGLHYVDKSGVVFAEVLPADDRDFPVITGVELTAESGGKEEERLTEALHFITLAEKGTVSLPKQNISEIHVTAEGGLVLFMADHAFPISLGKGEMKTKYQRLSTVLSWLYRREKFNLAASIDMNYMPDDIAEGAARRERVLVRMSEYKAGH